MANTLNVLVTGATGRLGRVVCDALVQAGYQLRATDLRTLRDFPAPVDVANLLDREACYRLVDGIDAVVHLGNHSNAGALKDAQRLFSENVTMNFNLIQACIECEVPKLVFSSSVQALSGCRDRGPGMETDATTCTLPYLPLDGDTPAQPGNPYALSKQVAEAQLAYASRTTGMQCIAIRFPWLMHPHHRKWLDSKRKWDDSNPRHINEAFSYLTMDDAARLIQRVLETELPGYRTYLAASRGRITNTEIPELLATVYAGIPLRCPADQITSLVDTSRITEQTGWIPSE